MFCHNTCALLDFERGLSLLLESVNVAYVGGLKKRYGILDLSFHISVAKDITLYNLFRSFRPFITSDQVTLVTLGKIGEGFRCLR